MKTRLLLAAAGIASVLASSANAQPASPGTPIKAGDGVISRSWSASGFGTPVPGALVCSSAEALNADVAAWQDYVARSVQLNSGTAEQIKLWHEIYGTPTPPETLACVVVPEGTGMRVLDVAMNYLHVTVTLPDGDVVEGMTSPRMVTRSVQF